MLYALAHFLRDKLPWIWDLVDIINSFLFNLRYGKELKKYEQQIIDDCLQYKVVPMRDVDTDELVEFFAKQPEEAFRFFKPHGFDKASIKKLQRNKAFLAYVLLEVKFDEVKGREENIAAYCFIRSFFFGKGFRGRMVGIDYRGQGTGTYMNKMMNDLGFGIGLRLFETVSKDNVASYRSALSASKVKVVEEMENNELYLEIVKE